MKQHQQGKATKRDHVGEPKAGRYIRFENAKLFLRACSIFINQICDN